MHYNNEQIHTKILVMLDAGDKMISLHRLDDKSAKTAFHAYL